MLNKLAEFYQNTTLFRIKSEAMNDLIIVFILCFSIISTCYGNAGLTGDNPVITLLDANAIDHADAWGGDLCIFLGDPSQMASATGINFLISDADTPNNMISATVSSSNLSVVPALVEFLKITYTRSPTQPNEANLNIMINPLAAGLTDIVISVKDKDKNTANYYIDLTVKECQTNLTLNQSDIDAVTPPNNIFQASNRIRTAGTPANTANGPIVRFNDDIVFNAGNCIVLNPGFEVVRRGLFLAEIKGCGN